MTRFAQTRVAVARSTLTRSLIAVHVFGLLTFTALEARVTRRRDERGSVTMEQVLWAVAVIAIVAIVVAAIKAFVTSESAKIR